MDQRILYLINQEWTSPTLDRLMAIVSSAPVWLPILALVAVAILVFGNFHARAMLVCAVIVIAIGDGLITKSLKGAVGRPRPEKVLSGVRMIDLAAASPRILAVGLPLQIKRTRAELTPPRGRSFPSGHTVNNIAIATLFTLFYRFGWLAYFPAGLVAYSRVYVGSHWPSDVLVSIFIGTGVTLVVVAVLDRLWRKFGDRVFPELRRRHASLLPPGPGDPEPGS